MKRKYVYASIYILLILVIFISSLRNAEFSSKDSGAIVEVNVSFLSIFIDKGKINISILSKLVRKLIGHFGSFCMCSIFALLTFRNFITNKQKSYIFYFLSGVVVAVVAELLQLIPVGRSCQISDMLINYSGYLFGFIICFFIFKFIKKQNITLN